jgi:pyrimidine operon attenuation protein/uracil phosphoribosyltransferase
MDLNLKFKTLKKRVDSKTGSILFYRDDIKGIPEKVYQGDGFTVEIKNKQVYLIDIYDAEKVLKNMLKNVITDAA